MLMTSSTIIFLFMKKFKIINLEDIREDFFAADTNGKYYNIFTVSVNFLVCKTNI